MNKIIKKISIVMMALTLCFSLSAVVQASSSKPYGSYYATVSSSTQAKASISKCSCSPVSNYLSCQSRVQCKDQAGKYTYTSWVTRSDYNISSKGSVWTANNNSSIEYIEANFQAKCGTGSMKYYSASDSR